jgi:hypothetical protein
LRRWESERNMSNFILVYTNDDYPDCGGGTFHERFETEAQLHQRAGELHANPKNSIDIALELKREFVYKPVEYVTKYEAEEI